MQYQYNYYFNNLIAGNISTHTQLSNDTELNQILYIITIIILLLECMLAFAANTLVLVAIKCYPNIRRPTTCLICGLSIADLLGATTTPTLLLLRLCRGTTMWVYVAHIRIIIVTLFSVANVVFSALIALERLLTLSFPLTYMTFLTTSRTALCVAVTWAYLVSVVTTMSGVAHSILRKQPQTSLSEAIMMVQEVPHFIMSMHFYVFLAVTIISYLLIAHIAVQKMRKDRTQGNFGSQWKITRMVVTVGLVFLLCYLPSATLNQLLRRRIYNSEQHVMYYMMTNCIFHISAIINPFMYAAKTTYFRIAFRKMLPVWLVQNTMLNNSIHVDALS